MTTNSLKNISLTKLIFSTSCSGSSSKLRSKRRRKTPKWAHTFLRLPFRKPLNRYSRPPFSRRFSPSSVRRPTSSPPTSPSTNIQGQEAVFPCRAKFGRAFSRNKKLVLLRIKIRMNQCKTLIRIKLLSWNWSNTKTNNSQFSSSEISWRARNAKTLEKPVFSASSGLWKPKTWR